MGSIAVPGIINKKGAKPARPKASSPGFKWPSRFQTAEQRQAFAAFLQKQMTQKKHTHITLAKHFWGTTTAGGSQGSLVAKWLKREKFPQKGTAAYLADYFGTSMEDMLKPDPQFQGDPSTVLVNAKGQKPNGLGVSKNKKHKHMNGEAAVDTRWTLPKGIDQPSMKIDTTGKDGLNLIEIKAQVPPQVTMAIFSMLHEYKREE